MFTVSSRLERVEESGLCFTCRNVHTHGRFWSGSRPSGVTLDGGGQVSEVGSPPSSQCQSGVLREVLEEDLVQTLRVSSNWVILCFSVPLLAHLSLLWRRVSKVTPPFFSFTGFYIDFFWGGGLPR